MLFSNSKITTFNEIQRDNQFLKLFVTPNCSRYFKQRLGCLRNTQESCCNADSDSIEPGLRDSESNKLPGDAAIAES